MMNFPEIVRKDGILWKEYEKKRLLREPFFFVYFFAEVSSKIRSKKTA